MKYVVNCISDTGTRRKNNQDSAGYTVAEYQGRQLAFLVLCDGMGGLEKGEIASAEVVNAFNEWFRTSLPQMLRTGFSAEQLRQDWYELADRENHRIFRYAMEQGCRMGTTLTAALFYEGQYYVIHVGDCRLYQITESETRQLTRDQTVTQREVDNGMLTPAEAENDPRQHILLQCLGMEREVAPDFLVGTVRRNCSYLICSDGFRHKYSTNEMQQSFAGTKNDSKRKIRTNLYNAIDIVKKRGETDNITACLVVTR